MCNILITYTLKKIDTIFYLNGGALDADIYKTELFSYFSFIMLYASKSEIF